MSEMCDGAGERQRPQDDQYPAFLAAVRAQFAAVTAEDERVFSTDATGLYDAFLAALPYSMRPTYVCNACRRFVERFGGLVAIDAEGRRSAAFWRGAHAPLEFRRAVAELERLVLGAKVTGVHLSLEPAWGLSHNHDSARGRTWNHLSVVAPPRVLWKAPESARNAALREEARACREAELTVEHEMLQRALVDYGRETIYQAHALLAGDALFRSEKVLGPATWLRDLRAKIDATQNLSVAGGLIWYAVATAPVGFARVRSGMIGTLLDDLKAGKPLEDVQRAFAAKMDPSKYQRPQAPATAGNIAAAERLVEKLGIAPALRRRFAHLEDIADAVWRQPAARAPKPAAGGVFGHLKPKDAAPARATFDLPATAMTWVRFAAEVLPSAERIELKVPRGPVPFFAFVTAEDPEAPPILQWDRAERRNPVSKFTYVEARSAADWGVDAGVFGPPRFAEVTAVTLAPWQWFGGEMPHMEKAAYFLIAGARDRTYVRSGLFFPETLRAELHPVRATLEAYAKSGMLSGAAEATACGTHYLGQCFRVTTADGTRREYTLDRWS